MKGTRPTPLTREEIPAVEARIATATPGEWQACRMVMEGEDRPLTAEEIGEYVMNSVRKSATESGTEDFLFIYVEKPNGPADVCHVGNGPTSPENADFIAHARRRPDRGRRWLPCGTPQRRARDRRPRANHERVRVVRRRKQRALLVELERQMLLDFQGGQRQKWKSTNGTALHLARKPT
jgi:hypothetical protein